MQTATVIGAGVIGLSTAIFLQEKNFQVEIITAQLPYALNTTSNRAAAIWFPYKAKPPEKINHWSRVSYDRFLGLSNIPESGVKMVDTINILADKNPWWLPAFPEGAIRTASPEQLPGHYTNGLIARVPFIDTPIYMQFLIAHFRANGGTITEHTVDAATLQELAKNQHLINCTGLAAKHLCNDHQLYPIQGYIAKVAAPQQTAYILRDDAPLAYIIPRADGVILGGTAFENESGIEPDASIIQSIIEQCQALSPHLAKAKLLQSYVGLRPARKGGIRLEKAKNIIHNYGHGGSGFTVSWGCAEAVFDLLSQDGS